jgi:hypothetical protein
LSPVTAHLEISETAATSAHETARRLSRRDAGLSGDFSQLLHAGIHAPSTPLRPGHYMIDVEAIVIDAEHVNPVAPRGEILFALSIHLRVPPGIHSSTLDHPDR